jgi:hypothetical protein
LIGGKGKERKGLGDRRGFVMRMAFIKWDAVDWTALDGVAGSDDTNTISLGTTLSPEIIEQGPAKPEQISRDNDQKSERRGRLE